MISEYEHFETSSSTSIHDQPASRSHDANIISKDHDDTWQVGRWLDEVRYQQAKAWLIVFVIVLFAFGFCALCFSEEPWQKPNYDRGTIADPGEYERRWMVKTIKDLEKRVEKLEKQK